MFRYKIDIIKALKEAGYNTGRIRKEKLFAESTLQAFRENKIVSWNQLNLVLHLIIGKTTVDENGNTISIDNIGDIVEWIPDSKD